MKFRCLIEHFFMKARESWATAQCNCQFGTTWRCVCLSPSYGHFPATKI